MLSTSHAHPLSPPLSSASLPFDFPPSSEDLQGLPSDGASPSTSTRPLFPPSPTETRNDQDPISSSSPSNDTATGLGFPSMSIPRLQTSISAGEPTDSPPPTHLSFPAPPHLLPPSSLAALPISHLVALTQALSRDFTLLKADLDARRKELEALEALAVAKGASSGEIERVKVRSRSQEQTQRDEEEDEDAERNTLKRKEKGTRTGNHWRIELDAHPAEENPQVEVDLDIEDLTEAISSNAFDIATSPVLDAEEARLRDRTFSLTPVASNDLSDRASITSNGTTPSVQSAPGPSLQPSSSSLKPARGRHASLSARFFGSIGGSTFLPTPEAGAPSLPHSPSAPSLQNASSNDSSLVPNLVQRNGRSGSIRSVNSVRSTSSKTSDAGSDSSRKTGYSDWFGWKGWNGTAKGSTARRGEVSPDEVPEEDTEASDADELREDRGKPEDMTTPVPDRSMEYFESSAQDDPATPTSRRARALSDASRSIIETESPAQTSSGHSSSSRRTSATRSTNPSTLEDSATSLSTTLSPPAMSTPDGKRSPPGISPPDSPSTSRTRSPAPPPSLSTRRAIATPALSTPMTTSTLSTPSISSPRRPLPPTSPQGSHLFERPPEQPLNDSDSTRRNSVRSIRGADSDDEEDEVDGHSTLRARTSRTGSAPAMFVPGVPLYSAPPNGAASRTSDQGYVAVAKGTIGRALGLGLTGEPAASTGMTRSHSDGVGRAGNDSGTFARLPSLSLSRYSLFSPPPNATTGPAPGALASNNSPAVVHATSFAPAPRSGTPTTMELDTISVEAAPPSLALHKPNSTASQADPTVAEEEAADDGPLIDRYGFIYDVHSGMELLKETRRREKEKEGAQEKSGKSRQKNRIGKGKAAKEEAEVASVATVECENRNGVATPTQLEVHPQLDAIREAMGLTPTNEAPNVFSPPLVTEDSKTLELDLGTPTHELPPVPLQPPKLVRAPASDDSCLSRVSGPQSMRALLGQLRNMSDTVERTQQTEWDAFIRKRQTKLAKLKVQQQQQSNAAQEGSSSSGGKGKGKQKKDRPKTIWGANALAEEKVEDSDGSREEGWTENLVGVAQMGTEGKSKKEDWNDFKELVRKGIPISYRPKIWGECSSANEAREPGVYQDLLYSPREDEQQCLKQIDMDCHRTFPTNVFFAGNGPGVAKLRNVLVAYSRRNPKVGYCQGMNNLVATLLLTHPAEEDAFWVLVCIVENILPSDYYTSHLLVSRADQQVLNDLVARILPSISEHLEEQGVELSAISFGWFLSLFTDVLPIQTLLRVWDLFFIHGTVLLFRVALSILKLHESELLACDSAAGLYGLLGSLPSHIYHADKLLKVACEDLASSVKDREVATLRRTHVAALQDELGIVVSDTD